MKAIMNVMPNPAVNRTLRDKAAQRRLLLRWAEYAHLTYHQINMLFALHT